MAEAIDSTWKSIVIAPSGRPYALVVLKNNSKDASTATFFDFDFHDSHMPDPKTTHREFGMFIREVEKLSGEGIYYLVESSGRGWHLWLISDNLRTSQEWNRIMRVVQKGADFTYPCKWHPFGIKSNDRQGVGMRVPGAANPNTWHPTREDYIVSLIHFHNIPRTTLTKENEEKEEFLFSKGKTVEVACEDDQVDQLVSKSIYKYAIRTPKSRHDQLVKLVGASVHQYGLAVCRQAARLLYENALVQPGTDFETHMEEFEVDVYPYALLNNVISNFNDPEREIYKHLNSTASEAFIIIRNFARLAEREGRKDFPISGPDLAARLAITPPSAYDILSKFKKDRIITIADPTWRPHVKARTYSWCLPP